MLERFQHENLSETDALQDYSKLQHEEKNDGKYMCTFPYPYMNGYLHLGKFDYQRVVLNCILLRSWLLNVKV